MNLMCSQTELEWIIQIVHCIFIRLCFAGQLIIVVVHDSSTDTSCLRFLSFSVLIGSVLSFFHLAKAINLHKHLFKTLFGVTAVCIMLYHLYCSRQIRNTFSFPFSASFFVLSRHGVSSCIAFSIPYPTSRISASRNGVLAYHAFSETQGQLVGAAGEVNRANIGRAINVFLSLGL